MSSNQGESSDQNNRFDDTMYDLFSIEVETQCKVLNQGLVELEHKQKDQKLLEALMRAAHSIKGAARVMSLSQVVRLAHAMEDCFVAAQNKKTEINVNQVDQLLKAVDLMTRLSKVNPKELNLWLQGQLPTIELLIQNISSPPTETKPSILEQKKSIKQLKKEETVQMPIPAAIQATGKGGVKKFETMKVFRPTLAEDRVLRITAENLNRLMGLAGESLVESRWLYPFGESLQNFKNELNNLTSTLELLSNSLRKEQLNLMAEHSLMDSQEQVNQLMTQFSDRLSELDNFIRRHGLLSDRLYQEVINSRMRPFADGVEAFPRLVRDLAHQLGKEVRLEILGRETPVDRDILEKLESPLSHLLRNAIDHGIETPEERIASGKPEEGVIKLEARHIGGMLAITVSDDGSGLDIGQLRKKIVEKNLVTSEMANKLTDAEVIDFLFLPGFSTSTDVTDVSGRGVGLNVVQNFLQEVGGIVRTVFAPNLGMAFHLQLPLTLSVIHTLLATISDEAYAFPLARIDKTFTISDEDIETIENQQFFRYEGKNIGLIPAWQVLELSEPKFRQNRISVIMLSERADSYGVVVDDIIGEKELVVQELDRRLGKIPDISAGALMEDGSPVFVIDVEDMILSIENLLSVGSFIEIGYTKESPHIPSRKRILIVDDSITVREVESRLLQHQGYEVETAVNGIDGWNAVRVGHFDLVITDIDMPRMNGIELLRAIKNDPKLQHLPVMIVSYKEDEEEHQRSIEAGADFFLTKSRFLDATLMEAVTALIGKP